MPQLLIVTMVVTAATFTPLQWLLSLSIAGTFIGHGCIALTQPDPKWFDYLQVAGVGRSVAVTLLPVLGAMDVVLGVMAVVFPHPLCLAWAVVWAVAAAAMRPLSGESLWEAVQLTGNFLPALALLWDTTAEDKTAYYWMLAVIVMMMGVATVTLLLRQTGLLADKVAGKVRDVKQRVAVESSKNA